MKKLSLAVTCNVEVVENGIIARTPKKGTFVYKDVATLYRETSDALVDSIREHTIQDHTLSIVIVPKQKTEEAKGGAA